MEQGLLLVSRLEVGREVVVPVGQCAELLQVLADGACCRAVVRGEGHAVLRRQSLHLCFKIVDPQAVQRGQAVFGFGDLGRGLVQGAQGQIVRVARPVVSHAVGDAVHQVGHVVGHVPGQERVCVEDGHFDGPEPRQVGAYVASVSQRHVRLGAWLRGVDVVVGEQVELLDDPVADAVGVEDLQEPLRILGFSVRQEVVFLGFLEELLPDAVLGRGEHDHGALVVLVHHERHPGGHHCGQKSNAQERFQVPRNEDQKVGRLHGVGRRHVLWFKVLGRREVNGQRRYL